MLKFGLIFGFTAPVVWVLSNYFFGERAEVNYFIRSAIDGTGAIYQRLYSITEKYINTGEIDFSERKVVVKPLD